MTDQSLFRYSQPIEVRFGDTDAMGHVNNARFFTYMETARLQYMQVITDWKRDLHGQAFILAHISCDFKQPLYFGETAHVAVRVKRLGKSSFDMDYLIIRQEDQVVVATGHSVLVTYDYATGKSCPIPEAWRKQIIAYEPSLS